MAPPAAMLPDRADMTGPALAAILIPPAGTICLAAWLALVFYAGRHHPQRAGGNPAPGRQSPGTAALAGRRQADARQPIRARCGDRGVGDAPPRQYHWQAVTRCAI